MLSILRAPSVIEVKPRSLGVFSARQKWFSYRKCVIILSQTRSVFACNECRRVANHTKIMPQNMYIVPRCAKESSHVISRDCWSDATSDPWSRSYLRPSRPCAIVVRRGSRSFRVFRVFLLVDSEFRVRTSIGSVEASDVIIDACLTSASKLRKSLRSSINVPDLCVASEQGVMASWLRTYVTQ